MLCFSPPRKRDRLPLLFVAFWSVSVVGLLCHLKILMKPPDISAVTYEAIRLHQPLTTRAGE